MKAFLSDRKARDKMVNGGTAYFERVWPLSREKGTPVSVAYAEKEAMMILGETQPMNRDTELLFGFSPIRFPWHAHDPYTVNKSADSGCHECVKVALAEALAGWIGEV